MDMKKLLESITRLEGKESMKGAEKAPTGPKFTGYWKGTDSATPGNKMVGGGAEEYDESILKDLSKGPKAKTVEEELAEAYAQFMEDDLGVEPKRPSRKGSRPEREYTKHGKPSKRYKEVSVNEHGDQEDYKPWGSQDLEPGQKAVQGKPVKDTKKFTKDLAKDFGKHLGQDDDDLEEGVADRVYTVNIVRRSSFGGEDRTRSTSGTIPELLDYFGYTLETGKSYEHERGRYKINMAPKNIKSLVDNLNKAASNAARNGHSSTYYEVGSEEQQVTEGRVKDVAIDLKELSDEEFLKKYKKTKAEMRSALSEAINPAQQAAIAISMKKAHKKPKNEGWGADAANARHAEQQSDWDKTLEKYKNDPKMTSRLKHLRSWKASEAEKAAHAGEYVVRGRGHKFPGEDLDEATSTVKYGVFAKGGSVGSDNSKPYKVFDTKEEALACAKRYRSQLTPGERDYYKMGFVTKAIKESSGHKVIDKKLKDRDSWQRFLDQTPEERAAHEKKNAEIAKKLAKDYKSPFKHSIWKDEVEEDIVPMANPQSTGSVNPANQPTDQQAEQDPKTAAQTAIALNTLKSAAGITAQPKDIAKALDDVSQGKQVNQQDMTKLKPMMDVMKTAGTDPKVAQQFKNLSTQAKQTQLQQQQQQAKQQPKT